MARQQPLQFTQAGFESLRNSAYYRKWNRNFEVLKRKICRRACKSDLYALRTAGANEDRLLTLLAFSVLDSDKFPSDLMRNKESLALLANQLVSVTRFAELLVNDPTCDGRFWLALFGVLTWDEVPKCGVIEAPLLRQMGAFIQLIKQRAAAMGRLSRDLKKR